MVLNKISITIVVKQLINNIMTELDIHKLGFQCIKQYEHDEFYTNRYTKGPLIVEFTYKGKLNSGGTIELIGLTIEEVGSMPITYDKLKQLISLLT